MPGISTVPPFRTPTDISQSGAWKKRENPFLKRTICVIKVVPRAARPHPDPSCPLPWLLAKVLRKPDTIPCVALIFTVCSLCCSVYSPPPLHFSVRYFFSPFRSFGWGYFCFGCLVFGAPHASSILFRCPVAVFDQRFVSTYSQITLGH